MHRGHLRHYDHNTNFLGLSRGHLSRVIYAFNKLWYTGTQFEEFATVAFRSTVALGFIHYLYFLVRNLLCGTIRLRQLV